MSNPDRNNTYNFQAFLDWRENCDYYGDDPFAQAVVSTFCGDMAGDRGARGLHQHQVHLAGLMPANIKR